MSKVSSGFFFWSVGIAVATARRRFRFRNKAMVL
ncbi:hypothetical protein ZOSMA_32G00720 [Zostera marina]|uniref:Uncharacterized protein n=1 Tax=Zostera marina TaxID=29655 RepID=A0A0K9PAL5_ZOSMR|nr:hypothetical protein ZOSMA_32G00720 [Zostera marina]